jgi:type IV secretory pathway VirB2 component (pilin)
MNDMMVDGASQRPIDSAVYWIQGALMAEVASIIAVIAVASVGLLLLSGRLDLRRGMQAVFGCFVLFGASSIASGIMQAMSATAPVIETSSAQQVVPDAPSIPPISQNNVSYDPYAGAAVPQSRR